MKISCQSSLFLFLLHKTLRTNKSVNRTIQHIFTSIAALFLSAALYAANVNEERLALLQPLVDNDLSFSANVTADSIILWEKLLSPQLEQQQEYNVLFPLKMMAVRALIAEGNISLAINNANLMYQKAKAINYQFGIALALRALGNTYLSSATPQAAIESYEEAIKIMQNIPHTNAYLKTTLFEMILIKIKNNQFDDMESDIKQLEDLCSHEPNLQSDFYLPCSYAYYHIQTNNSAKALDYLQQLEVIFKKYPYPYYAAIINYLYACYHIESKEYSKALDEYDKLISITKKTGSSKHVELLQERARILTLMGNHQEACNVYEFINARKDSLDALNYLRQINELHTLYQVDKNELHYLNIQKTIYFWSTSIILFIVVLIIIAIFHIKRNNNRLLQSQQILEKAKKQAEQSIRTKSLFLSNMSHEIRTPLNALSGFSSILTEETIDNETKQQCNDIIQQNSDLLLKLINDVIDLSILEIGKMTFKYNECDVVALCKNVIDMVEKIKQTNAEVRFSTTLSSLKLVTDNARLQQVLINLLINATKFTSQGYIILELVKQSDDTALFSVSDSGCGISKENQGKIFNRFEKLNENAQGTGLGLSICQLIIEQLGGKIWIDPEYDKGARFLFTHPIRCEKERKEEEK